MQDLILDLQLADLEDLLAEFNLFEVLRIERSELQYSALLSWLLNPRGSHGLRDYFLRNFLLEAAREAQDSSYASHEPSPFTVESWTLLDVEVTVERYAEAGHGFMDVLVKGSRDNFVCLIENKVDTTDHSGQLSRYLQALGVEYGDALWVPIYLTPGKRKPNDETSADRYFRIDYSEVVRLVVRALEKRGSTIGPAVASFLTQFSRSLRRNVVDKAASEDRDGINIDQLAYKVYRSHREAIDHIFKAKNLFETVDLSTLDTTIPQISKDHLQEDSHHNKS